jgi:hypothetical protein
MRLFDLNPETRRVAVGAAAAVVPAVVCAAIVPLRWAHREYQRRTRGRAPRRGNRSHRTTLGRERGRPL